MCPAKKNILKDKYFDVRKAAARPLVKTIDYPGTISAVQGSTTSTRPPGGTAAAVPAGGFP